MTTNSHLYIIAAMSENQVIGLDNRLPWHLPDEWAHFRKVTDGKAFIQGRKSFEAADALHSSYKNVVLSRNQNLEKSEKTERASDLNEGIALLKDENEVFVLGGASVFEQALPLAEKLYLTIVHTTVEGDAYFPKLDWDEWELISSEFHQRDERHKYAFSMNLYVRKES
ncbi:dihydrofolate reductase [Dyadobacter frigoris]|uniref:Dihydrofolate reductase n=1 Tax=Dyadobacter frigoris TaxID=2576211 RepID=A0A4U6D116_9BACT|nr:dihydrofolate reductase [Dyadobacter frigoris]TKT89741.1 dihydrofolate reductase [Dyadobacter frigoris]GLU54030.1 dihydrofolate reductase [Dyadobacter frigoris]